MRPASLSAFFTPNAIMPFVCGQCFRCALTYSNPRGYRNPRKEETDENILERVDNVGRLPTPIDRRDDGARYRR